MLLQIQTFSCLQEHQRVISQCVYGEARHLQRPVHAALQRRCQCVMLRQNRCIVEGRWKGVIHTPGNCRCWVGVNRAATQHIQTLHAAAGGETQDGRLIWKEGRKELQVTTYWLETARNLLTFIFLMCCLTIYFCLYLCLYLKTIAGVVVHSA